MKKILILFAHPAYQNSRINVRLSGGIADMEGITINDLYEVYPEFDIDVNREQSLLEEHDIIIFHHPLFWYSTPAILKEWQDLVLEHGWAYGSEGNALEGKIFFNIISTGGRQDAYTPDGYNGHTLRQLISPLEQTSKLCKMTFLPPFVVHGTHSINMDEVEAHRKSLLQLLSELQHERVDVSKMQQLDRLNDYNTLADKEA